ncbi:MAG TPA: ABC transporter substrate-binding protein, partial [Dehalococcoidia bacterium]|nr:ABC transporter substrate-binding protein [Dehalococcoidia bacterium]
RRGGSITLSNNTVPPSLDPARTSSVGLNRLLAFPYSRLYKFQTGPGIDGTSYTPVPDLAASYESADPATWTFKLRPNAKMHDVPPTNGRAVTAQDVVYSYQRFQAPTNAAKSDLNMVDSVSAADAQTVVFKLKYPYTPFLNLMAAPRDLFIIPHELDDASADKGGDAQQHMVGSGPFIFKSYQQAQTVSFARNPNYYLTGADGQAVPYIDAAAFTLQTDSNALLTQLNAGHIDVITTQSISLAQVQSAKQQNPSLQESDFAPNTYTNFFFSPSTYTDNRPPFNDVRLRRAISLAIDRDAINKQVFGGKAPGWDNVAIPAGFSYWWLDPKGKDMGPAGAWYKYDPAQAKQLLAAAGYPNGLTVQYHTTDAYGATYDQTIDALTGMLQAVGITPKMITDNYQSVWIPKNYSGNFEGMLATYIGFWDPDTYYTQAFTPEGSFLPSKVNDPQINQLLEQERREPDRAKRRDLVWQIQRRASDQMFQVPLVQPATTTVSLPTIHDYYSNGSSTGYGTEVYPFIWKEQ